MFCHSQKSTTSTCYFSFVHWCLRRTMEPTRRQEMIGNADCWDSNIRQKNGRYLLLPKTCDAAIPVMVHGGNSHAWQAYLDAPLDDMLMRCLILCVRSHDFSWKCTKYASCSAHCSRHFGQAECHCTIQMLCLYCTHMLGGHKHLHGCWTSRIHSPGPRHLANLWCIVEDFWFCHVIRILQLPTSLSTSFDLWIRPVEDVPLDDEDPGETRRPRVSYVWCVSYPKSWWQTWRGKSWHSRTLQSTSLDLKKEN